MISRLLLHQHRQFFEFGTRNQMSKQPDPTRLGFVHVTNLRLVSKEVSHPLVHPTCQASLSSPDAMLIRPQRFVRRRCPSPANRKLTQAWRPVPAPPLLRLLVPHSLSLLAKAGAEAFFGWWSNSLLLFPVCKCPRRTAAKLFPSGAPRRYLLGAILFVCSCLRSE